MYAYEFEGIRYDVGDKLGFLQATIEFALKKEELRDDFIKYLDAKPWEIYEDKELLKKLRLNAMRVDNRWEKSAK